jgi:Xaa-Pro aminopeptidase
MSKPTKKDPHAQYKARLKRLRRSIRDAGCDALLITNPRDIRYLTPFSGEDSWAIVAPRALVVISDFRFEEDLVCLKGVARVHMRKGSIAQASGGLVRDMNLARVGVQGEHMTLATKRAVAKRAGAKRLVETTGLLAELRMIKDDAEVRLIRKAIRVQERALLDLLPTITAGQTELQLAARLECRMKELGASGPSFPTIMAARANGSKPHAVPGRTKASAGKALLIDWGARVDGYVSDLTRTFSLGRWSRQMREVYEVVLEAQLAAIDAVRPGLTCAELDAAARRVIEDSGYGKRFGHALGHGIGLDVHEGPRIGSEIASPLKVGMVITIEPGVYLPGIGGVRIEDDILVTSRGGRVLSSLPKDLDWATL